MFYVDSNILTIVPPKNVDGLYLKFPDFIFNRPQDLYSIRISSVIQLHITHSLKLSALIISHSNSISWLKYNFSHWLILPPLQDISPYEISPSLVLHDNPKWNCDVGKLNLFRFASITAATLFIIYVHKYAFSHPTKKRTNEKLLKKKICEKVSLPQVSAAF